MKHRFRHQHVALALIATLSLAGLFYLPYLWVRTKTIDVFQARQHLLAQQAISGIQSYFAGYGKALAYFAGQPSLQQIDASGKELLQNFFSIHHTELSGIQRIDANGALTYAVPAEGEGLSTPDLGFCLQQRDRSELAISDLLASGKEKLLFYSAPVRTEDQFDGCIAFSLSFAHIAGQYLKPLPLLHDGAILLINASGEILHAPDPTAVGGPLSMLHGDPAELAELRTVLAQPNQALILLQSDPLRPADEVSDKVYALSIPVALPNGQRWSLLIITPAAKVLGVMAEFRSRWLLVTGIAIVAVGLLSFFLSGLTAKRRDEQALRSTREQLIGLLDLAPMGVFLLKLNGNIAYANQAALRMVEKRAHAKTIAGQSFFGLIGAECREAVAEKYREAAFNQVVHVQSARFLPRDRPELDVVITITPYRSDEIEQRIVIVRDVTEERRIEQRQRRLTEAFDQVKDSVLIADQDGIIEYVNASATEMTGYSREESLGRPVRLVWDHDQEAYFDQRIQDVVTLGEVWRGRIVNRRKDGSAFVAAATVSPVRDNEGRITHFVAVQRDITHETEIEARMRQAQKLEAIGTLAGGIAHDFNNILGGIIGFTDMALLQSTPGGEVHNNLLHIRQGGKRAADLVQQILTFSRQSVEKKEAVMMAPLIKESLKLLRASIPATIEIIPQLKAVKATVIAAPVQIQQIVMNLCANASHSMREQGGQLIVRLEQIVPGKFEIIKHKKDQDWVCLSVQDTGEGMGSELIDNIFTPFFTTKAPGEGTGMGLSVVHGIVQELDGYITVESELGKGSTFLVLLPLAESRISHHLLSSEEPLPTGRESILVIDDEKEIREICRMILNHLGYTVVTSDKSDEALALIKDSGNKFDLVITDQTMPKITGIRLTELIRQLRPDLPIIICTGYSDRLNYDIAREAGACDLLMKPVDLRGLATAVRAALDMSL